MGLLHTHTDTQSLLSTVCCGRVGVASLQSVAGVVAAVVAAVASYVLCLPVLSSLH